EVTWLFRAAGRDNLSPTLPYHSPPGAFMRSTACRLCALLVASLLACLLLAPAARPAGPPPRLTPAQARALELDRHILAAARKDSQLIANLTYLCDRIGPRLTGSQALNRASQWTGEQ